MISLFNRSGGQTANYLEKFLFSQFVDIIIIHNTTLLLLNLFYQSSTIASKINVTPKVIYLPISKLHSILAVANLFAHNNKSQICYCGQISLQSAAVN